MDFTDFIQFGTDFVSFCFVAGFCVWCFTSIIADEMEG